MKGRVSSCAHLAHVSSADSQDRMFFHIYHTEPSWSSCASYWCVDWGWCISYDTEDTHPERNLTQIFFTTNSEIFLFYIKMKYYHLVLVSLMDLSDVLSEIWVSLATHWTRCSLLLMNIGEVSLQVSLEVATISTLCTFVVLHLMKYVWALFTQLYRQVPW